MIRHRRMRSRLRTFSIILCIFGFMLWVAAAALYVIPGHASDVSIDHLKACELGIVVGGAFIVGAIALYAASV
jgi:hypothetical protein